MFIGNGLTGSKGGLLVILIDYIIFLSPFLDVTRIFMSAVSFFTQLDYGMLCLECFPMTYDLKAVSLELTDTF